MDLLFGTVSRMLPLFNLFMKNNPNITLAIPKAKPLAQIATTPAVDSDNPWLEPSLAEALSPIVLGSNCVESTDVEDNVKAEMDIFGRSIQKFHTTVNSKPDTKEWEGKNECD